MADAFALNFRADRAVEFYDEVSKLADYAFHDFVAFQVQSNSIIATLEWTLLDEARGTVGAEILDPVVVRRGAGVQIAVFSARSWCELAFQLRGRALGILRSLIDDVAGVPHERRIRDPRPADLSGLTLAEMIYMRPGFAAMVEDNHLPAIDAKAVRSNIAVEWTEAKSLASVSTAAAPPKPPQASREKLFPLGRPDDQNLVDCIVMLQSERDGVQADMVWLLEFFDNDERKAKLMQAEIARARNEGVTTLDVNPKRFKPAKHP